jgi:DNA-binding PadR family transcriptional regulator
MANELNENDQKLLGFCRDDKRSINEIANFLKISPASVSIKVRKLEKKGKINVDKKGHGKKTYVRTKEGDKTKENTLKILKELKRKKNNQEEITEEEYFTILPVDISDPKEKDKANAILTLPFHRPKLIQRYVKITEDGEKFLKENLKKEKD